MKKIILSVLMAIGLCAMCFADENHDERLIGKWEQISSYSQSRHGNTEMAFSAKTMEIKEDGTVIITSTGMLNGVVTTNEYNWSTKVEKGKSIYIQTNSKETPTYEINEHGELEFIVTRKNMSFKMSITDVFKRVE